MIAGPDTYNLNSRYIIWRFSYEYFIFDIKEMKIVQEFKGANGFAVSRDFKRVAFYTIMPNELHLFDIVQGE